MVLLAIDPGTTHSGFVLYDGSVLQSGVKENADMLSAIRRWEYDRMAVEMIASYGMAVGREVFQTCVWIGRFIEATKNPDSVELVYRKDVKLYLCNSPRAKDANVRQALLDMFPATGGGARPVIGTKSKPGPLFGVSSHAWSALAVAVTAFAIGGSKIEPS